MPSFTAAQAADILAIHAAIYGWGHALDEHNGLNLRAAAVLTPDCRYHVGGISRDGIDAIEAFYRDRAERLIADGPLPTMRHVIANLRVAFDGEERAQVAFLLVFFASHAPPDGAGACDPGAVADVTMDCRRDADGDWRIASFNSTQTFRRT